MLHIHEKGSEDDANITTIILCDELEWLMFAYFVVSLYCMTPALFFLYCNGSMEQLCCFFVV